MEYPKYKYHATSNPVVVNSKEDEDALGSEWADSPADHNLAPTAPSQEQFSDIPANQELIAEEKAFNALTEKNLRRVDLATAQRSVRKAPVKVLQKTSGDDQFGGAWTDGSDGTAYPVTE